MSLNETKLKQLMILSQKGDQKSYYELLNILNAFLKNYLIKKVNNKSHVDDISQNILIAVHKSIHTYDSEKKIVSWFLAISHHKLIDYFKSQKILFELNEDDFIDESLNPLEQMIDHQNWTLINDSIESLDDQTKTVIRLLKIQGLKVSDVAHLLNLSESNVKVIAHRGYEKLKNKLKDFQ